MISSIEREREKIGVFYKFALKLRKLIAINWVKPSNFFTIEKIFTLENTKIERKIK